MNVIKKIFRYLKYVLVIASVFVISVSLFEDVFSSQSVGINATALTILVVFLYRERNRRG
jgi:hypothetical protein